MMPEETVQAAIDLRGKTVMPVHWGRFTLAAHPWNESVNRLVKKAAEMDVAVTTPRIGETVTVNGEYPSFPWWNEQ